MESTSGVPSLLEAVAEFELCLSRLYGTPDGTVAAQLEALADLPQRRTELLAAFQAAAQDDPALARTVTTLWKSRALAEPDKDEEQSVEIDDPTSASQPRLEAFLSRAILAGERQLQLDSRLCLGHDAIARRNKADLEEQTEAAIRLGRELGDPARLAEALYLLWRKEVVDGNLTPGRLALEEALPLLEQSTDRHARARGLVDLAQAELSESSYSAARSYFERALTLLTELGDRFGSAQTASALANIEFRAKDYQRAKERLLEALPILRQTGRTREAACLSHLGSACAGLEQFEEGRYYYTQALGISRELGSKTGLMQLLSSFAWFENGAGNTTDRDRLWAEREQLKEELSDSAKAAFDAARTAWDADRLDEARLLYRQALPLLREAGEHGLGAASFTELGNLEIEAGNCSTAIEYLNRALRMWRRMRDQAWVGHTLVLLSRAQQRLGNTEEARASLEEARDTCSKLETAEDRGELYYRLGVLDRELHDTASARSMFDAAATDAGSAGDAELESKTAEALAALAD